VIDFFNHDIDFPLIVPVQVEVWVARVIRKYGKKEGTINYIFCSDKYLLEINKEYLNHDYFTDIITFNYNERDIISGDIFISLDTVKANAEEYKVTYDNELLRVIIHGILHLVGFNDKTEDQKKEMRHKEDDALNIFDS
jgi:probable rRNA maturation factor